MGIFSRGPRFKDMQTPEQQYLSSGMYQDTAENTRKRSAERNARYRREQSQEREAAATAERRKQVTQGGVLRRRGSKLILESGWQFATDKLPKGDLGGMEFRGGKLGDLTQKDLHDLATNHGPNCRCGLGR